jgi:hypothetical protein
MEIRKEDDLQLANLIQRLDAKVLSIRPSTNDSGCQIFFVTAPGLQSKHRHFRVIMLHESDANSRSVRYALINYLNRRDVSTNRAIVPHPQSVVDEVLKRSVFTHLGSIQNTTLAHNNTAARKRLRETYYCGRNISDEEAANDGYKLDTIYILAGE